MASKPTFSTWSLGGRAVMRNSLASRPEIASICSCEFVAGSLGTAYDTNLYSTGSIVALSQIAAPRALSFR